MRTSRDRYSRKQHCFLQNELMESNSCMLLMAPLRCLCAASLVTFALPNSSVSGKDPYCTLTCTVTWKQSLKGGMARTTESLVLGHNSPVVSQEESPGVQQDLGISGLGSKLGSSVIWQSMKPPVIQSDLPIQPLLAQTESGVGLAVCVQKEDLLVAGHSVYVWTGGVPPVIATSQEKAQTSYFKTQTSLPFFFFLQNVKWNCSYYFFSQKTFLLPAKVDWRRPRLEKIEISGYLTIISASPHGPLRYWGFCSHAVISIGISNHFHFLNKNAMEMLSPVSSECWSAVRWEKDLSGQTLMGKARQSLAKYSLGVISFHIFQFSSPIISHEPLP